jgi:hypothetical protein
MNTEVKLVHDYRTSANVRFEWIAYALVAVAVIIGIVVRFKGLGRWPFTDDEFYIAQSINFILDKGLPAFESGGYYTRGLLYQYVGAGFLTLFSNAEFWLRAIPATFNLVSIPALFWLGRRIGGKAVACAVVILFMLSIWEIEFSRFARMYSIFQAVFLWYLVALYKVLIDEDRSCEKWMYVLSAAAPLIYEGAIILALLNFLPFIYRDREKGDLNRILIPVLIFVSTYLFLSYDFRRMGLNDHLPEEMAATLESGGGKLFLPVFMLPLAFAKPSWTVFFMAVLVVNIWSVHRILSSEADYRTKTAFLLVIASALLHHFGLMAGFAVVLVSLYYGRLEFSWRETRLPLLIAVGASFGYWILFGVTTTHWHPLFPQLSDPGIRKYAFLLFNYPKVYSQMIWPWLKVMPVLSFTLGVVVTGAFVKSVAERRKENAGYLFLFAILMMMIFFVGFIITPYTSSRYTFFFYPLAILIGAASISALTRLAAIGQKRRALVFALAIASYMAIVEDYKIGHLYKIDSAEINFRTTVDRDTAVHYYHRLDYRTPAEIINAAASKEDIIISIFTPSAYYLNRVDYIYLDSIFHLLIESTSNGTKELWTNADLIHKEQQLWDLIQNSSNPVWVIAGSEKMTATTP